ncbi:MAG: LLM class flavin-dependent oxidoreductase [Ardenticatenales bacterium]|nr:LLM class flavin-dependent oxidoreductase [Ardenticatenales bacterium]
MRYGVTFPYFEARDLAELSHEAEESGWDGVFVWDAIWGFDVWVALGAAAMRTERVRLGPMLTPPSRRRPWKLASEVATLDRLSNGRVILSVGLGAPEVGFDKVGEETDRKVRAQLLDESLEIITGLWSGKPFSYSGQHYQIQDVTFDPPPIQTPRVPIWVAAGWPREKSMQRAVKYEGVLPLKINPEGGHAPFNTDGTHGNMNPDDIRAMREYVEQRREQGTPYDIVMEGETPGDDAEKARAIIQPYQEAGCTWWLENVWQTPWEQGGVEGIRARIRQGPPRDD